MNIPNYFCWTRFGTEAGETIESILARKEQERINNGGMFLWGIGNALTPSIRKLIMLEENPEVLFSPMKSKAKAIDVAPSKTVRWSAGLTIDGFKYVLPKHSAVTSRYSGGKNSHYALVCQSEHKLEFIKKPDIISMSNIKNILTGNKVGASQVTAVVEHTKNADLTSNTSYSVALRAKLVYPYFIKLVEPLDIEQNNFIYPKSNFHRHIHSEDTTKIGGLFLQ